MNDTTESRVGAIVPAPSLDEILATSQAQRIGRVDFSHRLAEPSEAPVAPRPTRRTPTRAAAASTEATEPVTPVEALEPPDTLAAAEGAGASISTETDPIVESAVTIAVAPFAHLDLPTDSEDPYLAPSVEALGQSIIARMRAAEAAMREHVAAVEAEAARRCELLTAQAELDAELIRLYARRESHAIMVEAQVRTGVQVDDVDGERLDGIGDAALRFAETFEASYLVSTPDLGRRS